MGARATVAPIILGDSFLYAGHLDGTHFLHRTPDLARGAQGGDSHGGAAADRAGRPAPRCSGSGLWLVQLLAATEAEDLARRLRGGLFAAGSDHALDPLRAADLQAGQVNGVYARRHGAGIKLERQLLDGATALSVQLLPAGTDGVALCVG